MSNLDTDTANIVRRLAEIQAAINEMTAEAESLKAELRTLPTGDHDVDGRPALRIIPTRRFDTDAAALTLPEDVRPECLAITYDATKVKKHLSEIQIQSFMVEVGKPKVVMI